MVMSKESNKPAFYIRLDFLLTNYLLPLFASGILFPTLYKTVKNVD
jgi:hypothetical protein